MGQQLQGYNNACMLVCFGPLLPLGMQQSTVHLELWLLPVAQSCYLSSQMSSLLHTA
jgi:hypothetical protein